MEVQLSFTLDYHRCFDCGRVYYCEPGPSKCPRCKQTAYDKVLEENRRLVRAVTSLRAYIKRMRQ